MICSKNKKKLKRADIGIMDRILVTIYEIGYCKKTEIARKSNMSYDNCMMYLEYLETVGFVEWKSDEDGFEMFCLTGHGIMICKRRLSEQFETEGTSQTKTTHMF